MTDSLTNHAAIGICPDYLARKVGTDVESQAICWFQATLARDLCRGIKAQMQGSSVEAFLSLTNLWFAHKRALHLQELAVHSI